MAISIPTAVSDALAAGAAVIRSGVVFDFPSGTWAFWDGDGDLTWGSATFRPGGGLIEMSEIPSASDMSSSGVTLKLRAVPDTALSPDVLATIESEQYHQRPATIVVFFFDPDTRDLLAGLTLYAGYVDQISHIDEGDSYHLEASLESRSRDHTKTGYRMHTTADQDRISPGDEFFRHVSTTAKYVRKWGSA